MPQVADESASRKRRIARFYQRFHTGLRRHHGRLYLLTLTSSNDAPEDINRSWRAFTKRFRRRCGGKMAYLAVKEVSAGRAHLHIVLVGHYLPQSWYSAMWREVHNSPIVDIRQVRGRDVVRYLAKYLGKAMAGRYWLGYEWVCRGWVGWSRYYHRMTGWWPGRLELDYLCQVGAGLLRVLNPLRSVRGKTLVPAFAASCGYESAYSVAGYNTGRRYGIVWPVCLGY